LSNMHSSRCFDDPDFLVASEIAGRQVGERLLERIVDFRVAGTDTGILLIRGLVGDELLPATPFGSFNGPWCTLATSSISQLMIMGVVGAVVAYADEKEGRLIQDVCPMPGREMRQENSGATLLELHTEDGFHPHKPDFLSLWCLRSDHDDAAITVAGSIRTVIGRLPESAKAVLREARFRIRYASSFVGDGPARHSDWAPVLSGPDDDPDLCLDVHATEPSDDEGAQALRTLISLLVETLVAVHLLPGDLLIIDNRGAVHGRTAFQPRFDGSDRWLRRCFAMADIRRSRGARPSGSRVHYPL